MGEEEGGGGGEGGDGLTVIKCFRRINMSSAEHFLLNKIKIENSFEQL